jgi:hypothetical protein
MLRWSRRFPRTPPPSRRRRRSCARVGSNPTATTTNTANLPPLTQQPHSILKAQKLTEGACVSVERAPHTAALHLQMDQVRLEPLQVCEPRARFGAQKPPLDCYHIDGR